MHHCHATGCTVRTKPEMLMCLRHWRMVPKRLQAEVWRTYRSGQCDDWQISHEYADAARAAVRHVAALEGRVPDTSVYDMLDPARYETDTQQESVMPEQKKKASFAARFGAAGKQAAAAASKKPVDYGRRNLPPGIRNGVADLINAELIELPKDTGHKQLDGSSAAGQMQLVLTGAVVTPKSVDVDGTSVNVEGLQFRKYVPLFQKGAKGDFGADWNFEACITAASNEMRKIAGEQFDTTDMDAAVAALANAKPKLRFHFSTQMGKASTKIDPKTGKPYPPRVNEYWEGSKGLTAAPPVDPGGDVQDDTTGGDEEAPAEPFNEFDDAPADQVDVENMTMEELAELADSEEEPAEGSPCHTAQAKISEAVTAAGHGDEFMGQYSNWAEIVAALAEQAEPEPEPEPEPAPAPAPRRPGPARPAAAKPAAKPAPKPAAKAPAKPAPKKK